MPVRLVTLDLDDTLWPCLPVIQAAERSLFAWLEAHAPRVVTNHDIDSLRAHRLALARQQPDIAHDVTALRLVQLEQLMREAGHAVELAERGAAHFREVRNQVTPYADVLPALSCLRQRFPLVSLTNGNAQLHRTPLRGCFDYSLDAGQVGAAKPDPRMFYAACDWAGVNPAHTLHIGDDPLRDVEAARQAGLQAVWLNREQADWPASLPPPDHWFTDMATLARWLLTESEDLAQ